MKNFRAYDEGYNPRTLYKIFANKDYHHDSHWLANYYVEQCVINMKDTVPFLYTEENFSRWMDTIYNEAIANSKQPHYLDGGLLPSGSRIGYFCNQAVHEFLLQRIPANSNDTAFLAEIGGRGCTDPMEALLQKIKHEESGSGNSKFNHSNIYREGIRNLGYSLHPSERLHEDYRLLDKSFADPAFQLAISCFPKRYQPEIIGMTIMLEWTGSPEALTIKKLLDSRNIDSTFYKIHVLADNKHNGHAYDIRTAVPQYLERIKVQFGEIEMQNHWERIYEGYSTWQQIISDFELNLAYYLVKHYQTRLAA